MNNELILKTEEFLKRRFDSAGPASDQRAGVRAHDGCRGSDTAPGRGLELE